MIVVKHIYIIIDNNNKDSTCSPMLSSVH